MAALKLTFQTDPPLQYYAKKFTEFRKELTDFKPVWRQLLPILAEETIASLKAEGRPIGASWRPLHQMTIHRKSKRGQGRAALIASGRLLRELDASKGKRSMTKKVLKYGPKSRYAYVQQWGSKSQGIPARAFMGWTERGKRAAHMLMQLHAQGMIAKVFNDG